MEKRAAFSIFVRRKAAPAIDDKALLEPSPAELPEARSTIAALPEEFSGQKVRPSVLKPAPKPRTPARPAERIMKRHHDMTRLSRLTNILLQLQAKRVVTSTELADRFGISQRTVYRDIKALEEAGVPIIGETGTGYSLMEGYRLPPVMFTEAELNALLTAQQYLQNNPDPSVCRDFDQVVAKVNAILRYAAREQTEKLSRRVKVLPAQNSLSSTGYLSQIQGAILHSRVVRIEYRSISAGQVTERAVAPLAVYYTRNNWVLIAHCRLRNGLREFRLDRITHLQETGAPFPETDFSFDAYIRKLSENS